MRTGRVVSEEDRARARSLIARVDQKIAAGLLALEPDRSRYHWSGSLYGVGLSPGPRSPVAYASRARQTKRPAVDWALEVAM